MSKTDEFVHIMTCAREKQEVLEQVSRERAYKHGDGAAGCTKGRWIVSDWKKSESMQGFLGDVS